MNPIIYQKIQNLKEEIKYLEDNKVRFLETIRTINDTRKIVERSVYLCSEIVLDIADLLIVSKDLPKPETYRESINMDKIQQIRDVLSKNKLVLFAYLFGSRALNRAGNMSVDKCR